MSDKALDTLKAFYGIFRGNTSSYVVHKPPFRAEKDSGKIRASKVWTAVYNDYNPPPEGKEAGDFIPVTIQQYKDHLNGGNGLAIAPITNLLDKDGNILKRNVCYYAALDLDTYDVNFAWIVRRLYDGGFKFAAFQSKSGGLHIYFFFAQAEDAGKVIEVLKKIAAVYGLTKLFTVEVFPKQASLVPGKDGGASCLFLPFYNAAHKDKCKTKMLSAEGKLIGIMKALPIIETMFTSVKEMNDALRSLPYSDAPYCIQAILLSGALWDNAGRNGFLFCAAIYLKKKNGDDNFRSDLLKMNGCLEAPLETEEVDGIYKSVTEHSYDNYACGTTSCHDFCDKEQCKLRKYGKKEGGGNLFTGADCWGDIIKYVAGEGEDPYYVWNIRVNADEEFRQIRIDSVEDLHSQTAVQRLCLRDLNWMPYTVKQRDWITILNKAQEGVKEGREGCIIKVPRSADTTEMSRLRNSFYEFLTHNQVQGDQAHKVNIGRVYRADGAYYFSTAGLMDYLDMVKVKVRPAALIGFLDKQQCKSDVELSYKTLKGEVKTLKCWKKAENEELLKMDEYLEDMYERDADIIQRYKPDKDDSGEEDNENSKF